MTADRQNHSSPPRVAVAQLGARRHYAVPSALEACGLLDSLFTDFYATDAWEKAGSLLPGAARLLDRRSPGIPGSTVRHFPLFGLHRAWLGRRALSEAGRIRNYADANRRFCKLVCSHWPDSADTFYVFNSAGLEILEEAGRRGLRRVVDQITAPWEVEQALLDEERCRFPDWEPATDPAAWAALAERERQEWEMADRIVCGSLFVKDSIARLGGPSEKCAVVPYGTRSAAIRSAPRPRHAGPLRVLFAGTLQLRKGIQYLAAAARLVPAGKAVFRVVGASQLSQQATDDLRGRIELRGAVPRSAMRLEYEWADVLATPSVSEGSANVCYEALAEGLPVIATPNTGSVVRDGSEGFVIPIRSAEALAECIARLADDHSMWTLLSQNACRRAAEFSDRQYASALAAAVTRES